MISHKHKFIYSHIPKAGGTTIEKVLWPYASKTFGRNAGRKWLRNKKLFNAFDKHQDYYQFTFARNPWERLLSCYIFFRSRDPKIKCSFQDFVKSVNIFLGDDNHTESHYSIINNNTCSAGLNSINIKAPCGSSLVGYHVLPQIYFVGDNFNFIGKMERLQHDFNFVCGKIGIPKRKLPHKNKSNHKHYTEYYDEETRQIVAEKYAKDIEYFGYEFG